MVRVVKSPEIRRNELLDCAQSLFFTRGYEATTIAEIILKAGVSKGGFYHHFDSKEALLEALAVRVAQQAVDNGADALRAPGLNALARLNAYFALARHWKIESAPHMRAAFAATLRPENDLLYQRIAKAMGRVVSPIIARIIEEGAREGVFRTPDPALAADLLLHLATARQAIAASAFADIERGDVAQAAENVERRIAAEETIMDRVLGVPEGSVRMIEPGFVYAVFDAMR